MMSKQSQFPELREGNETAFSIEYEMSDSLLTAAIRQYWFRSYAPRGIVVNLILVGYIFSMWFLDRVAPYRWHLTIAVACVVLYSILTHIRFFVRCKHVLGRLPNRHVKMRLTDDALIVERANDHMTIRWSSIIRLIKSKDQWLLKYGPDQIAILPLDRLDDDARQFIEARLAGSVGTHDDGCPPCRNGRCQT
jgi:YcxB-like protein